MIDDSIFPPPEDTPEPDASAPPPAPVSEGPPRTSAVEPPAALAEAARTPDATPVAVPRAAAAVPDAGPAASAPRGKRDERPRSPRGPRPDLVESKEPVYRESAGYRMRLEPADLTRLRELPGSKGKSDRELGEIFFDGQTDRFTASLAEDVPSPAEVRVVIDPYSRQAFLAVEKRIRSILSF